MNRMERAAWALAVMFGWGSYYAVRAILRRLDLDAWKAAWDRVPVGERAKLRDSLLAEEGITSTPEVRPDGD